MKTYTTPSMELGLVSLADIIRTSNTTAEDRFDTPSENSKVVDL